MIDAAILWGHAIAALCFGVLCARQARHGGGWTVRTLTAALALTALWALGIAGIGTDDASVRLADGLRTLAWLAVMLSISRREAGHRLTLNTMYAVVAAVSALGTMLTLVPVEAVGHGAAAEIRSAAALLGMMSTISALVLVHPLATAANASFRVRLGAMGLALIWAGDFAVDAAIYVGSSAVPFLTALRGCALILAAGVFALSQKPRGGAMTLSRPVVARAIVAIALICYGGLVVLSTALAQATLPSAIARMVETAIVLGSAVTLLTVIATPWWRAWGKVMLAKHLFRHRYDYRAEWLRFTATLGRPGEASLASRVVKAVADLTDAPAGLLLVAAGDGLEVVDGWNWEAEGRASIRLAAVDGHVVDLDAVRSDNDGDAPAWLLDAEEAWVLVPLVHLGAAIGAIVLARPAVARALDWEDFDLLRLAGQQAASYLAEDRAHTQLAEAERFDEFNRRFAFIMHDLKNMVSQLTLVARNAERHADNPAFRADMVATLGDTAGRMTALLARLSHGNGVASEQVQPADCALLARQVARRSPHPVEVDAPGQAIAPVQPAGLEQALVHLIQNAADANAPDRPIRLHLYRDADLVTLDVIDSGCGMTPAFVRDQLFRPFASTKRGGFGLGAYEARQLVEAMGGRLDVHSREGEGTRFRITLPAAHELEAAA